MHSSCLFFLMLSNVQKICQTIFASLTLWLFVSSLTTPFCEILSEWVFFVSWEYCMLKETKKLSSQFAIILQYFETPSIFLIKALHSPLWINIALAFQRIWVQNERQTAGQQSSHLHRHSCIDIIIGCNLSACGTSWFHLSPQRHNEQRSSGTNE